MASRSRQRTAAKQIEILDAARDVFRRHGARAKMSDIAVQLGIDTSSLYYYYKGIPDILNALLEGLHYDLTPLQGCADNRDRACLSVLHGMLSYILRFYYRNLELIRIVLTQVSPLFESQLLEEEYDALNTYLKAYWSANELLLEYIEKAQREGTINREFPPDQMLHILRGAVWGFVASWERYPPAEDDIPQLVNRILRIIK